MTIKQTFETKLGKIEIPEIDVHDTIMKRIERVSSRRKRVKNPTKIVAFASVLLIAIMGSGYAYLTSISLWNDQGEQTISIKAYDQDNKSSVVYTDAEWAEALERIQPGEAIAIFKQEGNPEGIVSVMEKPRRITSLEALAGQGGDRFGLPLQASKPIKFVEGSIQHRINAPDTAQLHKQSLTNGGQLVAMPVDVENEITGITVKAQVEGDLVSALITEAKWWGTYYTNLSKMSNIAKVNIAGAEALFSTSDGRTELVWRSGTNQSGFFYRIFADTESPQVKEKMTALLNWLIQANG